MTVQQALKLKTADVKPVGEDGFDKVRLIAQNGMARVWLSGRCVWEACYVSIDKTSKRTWMITLVDGPDVAVVSHCQTCTGR